MRFREKLVISIAFSIMLLLTIFKVYLQGELAQMNVLYADVQEKITDQQAINDELRAKILDETSIQRLALKAHDRGFVPMTIVVIGSEK